MKKNTRLILFILTIMLLGIGGRCRPRLSQCSLTGIANTPFVVTYPSSSCSTYRGRIGSDGVGRYPTCGGSCGTPTAGFAFGFALSSDPSSLYLPSPPASGTIYGQGMSAAYGMPLVEYFDVNGYYIGESTATAVAPDGTSLQAPIPDMSGVYDGTYIVRVTNVSSGGQYIEEVGTFTGSGWGRPRPDSDGDGWYDDEDCYPYNSSLWSCEPPPDPCYPTYQQYPQMEQQQPCYAY
jgi:hypothetical protein